MNTHTSTNNLNLPSAVQKWCVAAILALIFALASSQYVALLGISIITLQAWSFIFAAVASLLFAIALSMGSISYYAKWPDMRLGYQKMIGVLAFWLSCLYCLTLVLLYPETYWYGFLENIFSADIFFGSVAMLIFAGMVTINSKLIAPYFHLDTIKFVLGLGYIGYALLVVRAILIEWPVWESWLMTLDGYPPGRLLLSIIALLVLLLRISIPIHKSISKPKVA